MADLSFKQIYIKYNLVLKYIDCLCKNVSLYADKLPVEIKLADNKINNYLNSTILKMIVESVDFKKDLNLLDLGCGSGEKGISLKQIFPKLRIYGLETTSYDDPDHIERKPYIIFEKIYPSLNNKYKVDLGLYDGLNIPFSDSFFDIIVLYAVIEHIAPENRKVFIDTISKKLKKDGYIVITRCPRYWGLMEFISRKLKLGAHPWVLKKNELLGLFDKDKFSVEVLKRMNNIPNNHVVSKYFHKILIPLDKFLDLIHWPFSTDYFLIVKKITNSV